MYDHHHVPSPCRAGHSRLSGISLRLLVELPVLQAQPEDTGNPGGEAPESRISDELHRIHLWGNVQFACERISIGALRIPNKEERERIVSCITATLPTFLGELLTDQLELAIKEGQARIN